MLLGDEAATSLPLHLLLDTPIPTQHLEHKALPPAGEEGAVWCVPALPAGLADQGALDRALSHSKGTTTHMYTHKAHKHNQYKSIIYRATVGRSILAGGRPSLKDDQNSMLTWMWQVGSRRGGPLQTWR